MGIRPAKPYFMFLVVNPRLHAVAVATPYGTEFLGYVTRAKIARAGSPSPRPMAPSSFAPCSWTGSYRSACSHLLAARTRGELEREVVSDDQIARIA